MKRYIITLFVAIISFSASAVSRLISDADKAYMDNDFQKAFELYMEASRQEGTSSVLYYNIGNTYYRLDQPGNAVVYYKKALKLDPGNSDAQRNLEFVRTKLIDEQSEGNDLSKSLADRIMSVFTPDGWAVAAIVSFVIVLIAITIYILSRTVAIRKAGFFGGIIFLILTVVSTLSAFSSARKLINQKEAVITVPATILSTVPRVPHDKAEEAFSLHEGAVVEILDSISVPTDTINPVWYEVKADENHRAWIPSAEITKI